jgi:ATP-binding cassette, subfamily B, bacterial
MLSALSKIFGSGYEVETRQRGDSLSTAHTRPGMANQFRLLRYVRPYWRPLIVLLAAMLAEVGLGLLQPWPIKLLIDSVLGHHPAPHALVSITNALPGGGGKAGVLLWAVAAGTVLIFVLTTAMDMVASYAAIALGQRMTFALSADVFLHLQRLSLRFHSRRPVGDSIQRVVEDTYCLQTLVVDALLPALQALGTVVGMFVIMWALQPTLAFLSLALAPFLFVSIRYLSRPMKDRTRERRDLEGRMTSLVEQAITAVPAVQSFTREELEYRRFRRFADQTVIAYLRTTFAGIWFKLIAGLITAVGTAVVIYVGAHDVMDGTLTAGALLVFLAYLTRLYDPLNSLAYTAATLQISAAQADRVFEILDTPIEVADRPGAVDARVEGPIEFEHVTFGFEPGRPILKDVSFTADSGTVMAIVGPTGAGKTTLVNHIPRFHDPWEGRVTIAGRDIRDFKIKSLRQQVALVLQDPYIFPLTAAENIAYGRPDASSDQIVAAAKAANAHDFITRLPEGYDSLIGERGATLSGGEKQRLSIARAFLKDSPLLILDEPTSALDARTESVLLDALDRLMDGRITFLIAHRLSTIRNADQILVVDEGRVVERGSHAELLDLDGLYATLYCQQMEITRHHHAPANGKRGAFVP